MAKPKIEIDMVQLAAFMRFKPTEKDCAAFFKCSEDTIERRIHDETGLSFAEFREQNMVHTRFNLIRTALKKAESGDNVMLIFSLKNLCGWRDKQPGEDGPPVVVNNFNEKSEAEIDARIKQLMKEKDGQDS